MPGAERISDAELAKRRAEQPLKSKAEQKPADEGFARQPVRRVASHLLRLAVYHHGRKNLYGRAATADRRKRSSE